uniref:RNA-directed RNA polymerase n=1 Tax=Odorous house ant virus 2 TaxID=3231628 RepID=A0AAU8HXH5_9VIRU
MGQGDNQILKLKFPNNMVQTESNQYMYRFLNQLNEILLTTGPPLKLEETWASRDLFVYGKYIIYKEVPMPMSGKRIARIFRLSNEDYPTIESALSSATANLTAALANSVSIGPLMVLYLAEVVGILQLNFRSAYLQPVPLSEIFSNHYNVRIPSERLIIKTIKPVLQNSILQNDNLYEALLLFPRALGGFPILNIFDCLLRGFPDEVSFAISSLKCFLLNIAS